MSVTFETSHSPIGPCGQSEQSPFGDSCRYAATASLSSTLDCGENIGLVVHTVVDIDPEEPANIASFLDFE